VGNVYYVARPFGDAPATLFYGPLYASQMYEHLQIDFSNVDGLDAALDLVGLITNFVPPATVVGGIADTLSIYRDAWALRNARVSGASEEEWQDLWLGFGLDVAGYLPIVGFAFDVWSLARNVGGNTTVNYRP
jgi:hypothetical protein